MVEAHVSDFKKKVVKDFGDLMKEYPIVGAVNMENMPAPQLQKMREQLRDTVVIKMTKRRLMNIILNNAKGDKPGIEKLTEHLRGMPALLFTKENPFKLTKKLNKSKSSAPAKGGQTAPNDILIPAGPTPFAPGPIIGELGAIGLKTGVEDGKVAIKEDSVVVKDGEVIEQKVAELLTRLGIEPMEVGLDLVATYENGTIFTKDVLSIDEDKFMEDLTSAAAWAVNLSVDINYPTKDTIGLMIGKAYTDAKGLALSEEILADDVVEELIGKAESQMISLKDTANIDVTVTPKAEEKKDEDKEEPKSPKEEPKVEEKKEEPKEESKPEVKEEPKAEPKVEEKKEEVKPEPAKEEPKLEPKPEAKPDVPKTEPQEAVEEKKEEIKEKVEDIKEEVTELKEEVKAEEKKEEPKKEEIKEKVEEIKEEVTELKEEVKAEVKKEAPKLEAAPQPKKVEAPKPKPEIEQKPKVKVQEFPKKEEPQKIEQQRQKEQSASNISMDIKKMQDDVAKIKKKALRGDIPTANQRPENYKNGDNVPSAHDLVEDAKKTVKKKDDFDSQALFEKLKKKGTLREGTDPQQKPSDVPSISELSKKRKKI